MAFWKAVLSLQLFQSRGVQLWVTKKEFMEPWLQDFSGQTRRDRGLGNTSPALLGSDWENWEDKQALDAGMPGFPWKSSW